MRVEEAILLNKLRKDFGVRPTESIRAIRYNYYQWLNERLSYGCIFSRGFIESAGLDYFEFRIRYKKNSITFEEIFRRHYEKVKQCKEEKE